LQRNGYLLSLLILGLAAGNSGRAFAQATPTASEALQISGFGTVDTVYTGLALGKNASFTAGVDATIRPFYGLYPSLEVRGTIPWDHGSIDGQKNVVGGLVLSKHIRRYQPYGDIEGGRGELTFSHGGYLSPDGAFRYVQTAGGVIGGGGGANILITDRFFFKADFQFQRYSTPVSASNSVYGKEFGVGLGYRFGFGGLARRR
jgi:hypothetical protein